jgi:hypothetical protein
MAHKKRIEKKISIHTEKKKEKKCPGYRHYSSLAPSGGLRVANGGMCDDRDSEARWVWVQIVFILSLDRSAL